MPRASMFTIIAYDVVDDSRRRRVAELLEDRAVRVQKSVFEAWLTESQTADLARRIEAHLIAGDSLRIYVVGQSGLRRCRCFGGPAIVGSPGFLLV